ELPNRATPGTGDHLGTVDVRLCNGSPPKGRPTASRVLPRTTTHPSHLFTNNHHPQRTPCSIPCHRRHKQHPKPHRVEFTKQTASNGTQNAPPRAPRPSDLRRLRNWRPPRPKIGRAHV